MYKESRQKNGPLYQTVNVEVVHLGLDSFAFLTAKYKSISKVTLSRFYILPIICEKKRNYIVVFISITLIQELHTLKNGRKKLIQKHNYK